MTSTTDGGCTRVGYQHASNCAEAGQHQAFRQGISPQHPQPISHILSERFDKSDSTHFAARLLEQRDVFELASGRPGLLRIRPLDKQAQVRLDLVVELLIRSVISEQSPKSMDYLLLSHQPQDYPGIRSQISVSGELSSFMAMDDPVTLR